MNAGVLAESTMLVAASSVTPSRPARAMNTVTANTSRKICAPPGAPSSTSFLRSAQSGRNALRVRNSRSLSRVKMSAT